jgi:hypothetical protein
MRDDGRLAASEAPRGSVELDARRARQLGSGSAPPPARATVSSTSPP